MEARHPVPPFTAATGACLPLSPSETDGSVVRPGGGYARAAMLSNLPQQPADALLALIKLHNDDPRTSKIDLGVGVYRTGQGDTPVFGAIKAAEQKLVDTQDSKSYLGPEGDMGFVHALMPHVFGGEDPSLGGRIDGMQTPGGTGAVRLAKVPTTLPNQAGGVLAAFETAGADLSGIDLIVHGTTTTTNAVLERQLARTGLITTLGFRDVLELGRRTRPQAYGMHGQFRPVIPRDLRLEVPERMDARGRVLTPLDEDAELKQVLAINPQSISARAALARTTVVNSERARRFMALRAGDYFQSSVRNGDAGRFAPFTRLPLGLAAQA